MISKALTLGEPQRTPDFCYLSLSHDGVSSPQSINDTKLSSLPFPHTTKFKCARVCGHMCVAVMWKGREITEMQTRNPLCKVFFGYTTEEPITLHPTCLPTWDRPNPLVFSFVAAWPVLS